MPTKNDKQKASNPINPGKEERSNASSKGRHQTGGNRSEPSPRSIDQDSQRDLHLKEGKGKERK
jgi:hypothetical protein